MDVEIASEYRYRDFILPEDALFVVVSQSGETADTIAALREAKRRGVRTLSITNVVGSTVAREADHVIVHLGGPGNRRGVYQGVCVSVDGVLCDGGAFGREDGLYEPRGAEPIFG